MAAAACTPSVLLSLRDNVRRHVCTPPRKKRKQAGLGLDELRSWGGGSLFFLYRDFYDLRPDRGNELFRGRTAKVSGSVSVCVHFFFLFCLRSMKALLPHVHGTDWPHVFLNFSFIFSPSAVQWQKLPKLRRNCRKVPGLFSPTDLNSFNLPKIVFSSSLLSTAIGCFYNSANDTAICIQELLLY